MGNLCYINILSENQLIPKKRCIKCNDIFRPSYGGFSERTSCRLHLYKDGICKYCQKEKHIGSWNCYHSVY